MWGGGGGRCPPSPRGGVTKQWPASLPQSCHQSPKGGPGGAYDHGVPSRPPATEMTRTDQLRRH